MNTTTKWRVYDLYELLNLMQLIVLSPRSTTHTLKWNFTFIWQKVTVWSVKRKMHTNEVKSAGTQISITKHCAH